MIRFGSAHVHVCVYIQQRTLCNRYTFLFYNFPSIPDELAVCHDKTTGPNGGFEDRKTFAVPHRDQFDGTPITHAAQMDDGSTVVSTEFYSVGISFSSSSSVRDSAAIGAPAVGITLKDASGHVIYAIKSLASVAGGMKGPEPAAVNSSTVLAIADSPRFVPPEEGPTPPASR